MPEIIMPDGRRIDMTEPSPFEQQVMSALQGVIRQLDILIRLECGALKRATLKQSLIDAEATLRAMAEEAQAQAQEAAEAPVE